jgi:type II secretory pathway pseudopilin PulG
MKLFTSSYKRAFSLMEVAIGVAIVGIVTFPIISISSGFFERAKHEKTMKSISVIKEALISYYMLNKAMPCPADPTLSPNYSSYATPMSCYSTSGIAIGSLPTDTIGLSRDFMLDGYERKFTYAVAKVTTSPALPVRFYRDNTTKSIIIDSGNGTALVSGSFTGDGQKILITSATNSVITNDAFFVIISHGTSGKGAFLENGSRTNLATVNSVPSNVLQGSVSSYLSSFKYFTKGDNDDDTIQYATFNGTIPLLQDYGYIECPEKTFTDNNPSPNTNYTFARTKGNTTAYVSTTISCPSGSITQMPSAFCSKSGEWTSFRPQLCGNSVTNLYGRITIGDISYVTSSETAIASSNISGDISSASKYISNGVTYIKVNVANLVNTNYIVQVTLRSNAGNGSTNQENNDLTVSPPLVSIVSPSQFIVSLKELTSAPQNLALFISINK